MRKRLQTLLLATALVAGLASAASAAGLFDATQVREPASLVLLGSGLLAVAQRVRRRQRV